MASGADRTNGASAAAASARSSPPATLGGCEAAVGARADGAAGSPPGRVPDATRTETITDGVLLYTMTHETSRSEADQRS
jgi:hypothetical protein